MKAKWNIVLTYALINLALCLFVWSLSPWGIPEYRHYNVDSRAFHRMAEGDFTFDESPAPDVYRFLIPFLAGVAPFSINVSFCILSLLGLTATGVVFGLFMRDLGAGRSEIILGFALLNFSYGFRWSTLFPVHVDPWSYFLVVLGFRFLYGRKPVALGALISIGVMVKESTLLLLPLILFAQWDGRNRKRVLAHTLLTALPPLLLFFIIRYAILVKPGGASGFSEFYLSINHIGNMYDSIGGFRGLLSQGYLTFGFLWLLALYLLPKADPFIRRMFLPYLILCFSVPFVSQNVCRQTFLFFPILFGVIVPGFKTLSDSRPWRRIALMVLVGSGAAAFSQFRFVTRTWLRNGFMLTFPMQYTLLVGILIFIVVFMSFRSDDGKSG